MRTLKTRTLHQTFKCYNNVLIKTEIRLAQPKNVADSGERIIN